MSYYTKRIISIEDSNEEKLKDLSEIFFKETGYSLKVFPDHLDDSNWNAESGISDFLDENTFCRISEIFAEKYGDCRFIVHCITEDNAIYEYECWDGGVIENVFRETDQWYKHYSDKSNRTYDKDSYYEDPGFGDDYWFKYGNESVPAGYGNTNVLKTSLS